MPFKKGDPKPPNSGRKTNALIKDVKEAAQRYTASAVDRLVEIMVQNEDFGAAVRAACALLDRGWGRPSQTINATVNTVVRVSNATALEGKLDTVLARRAGGEAPRPTVQ
jgi:hypothetical protein